MAQTPREYLVELLDGAMKVEADMDRIERKVDLGNIGPHAEAILDKLQRELDLQFAAICAEGAKFGIDGMALVDARQQGRKQLHEMLDKLLAESAAS